MNEIKLKEGNVYIIKKDDFIEKVVVLEITQTSVLYHSLDFDYYNRVEINEFIKYNILEDLGEGLGDCICDNCIEEESDIWKINGGSNDTTWDEREDIIITVQYYINF